MKATLGKWYDWWVFKHASWSWILLVVLLAGSAYFAQNFRMDASADALVLENDADLRYFRQISEKYGSQDFLFLAYKPKQDELISKPTFDRLDALKNELLATVPVLDSVFTLVDAPLIDSPRVGLSDLSDGLPTVRSARTDLALAKREFSQGAVYGNNLVSKDASITTLLLNFKNDEQLNTLLKARNDLRLIKLSRDLSSEEQAQLATASEAYTQYLTAYNNQRSVDIAKIRSVMDHYRDHATLFLGGPSMIASDMVDFISRDLMIFGVGVLLLLLTTLAVIFRTLRWIALPMLICAATALVTTGLLGLLDWPVTVISSNYLSLLLIITLSMNIHLIVRFRILQAHHPELSHTDLIKKTIKAMAMPCFYMTITTMVAFGSLVVSGIRPVIDFGYMMMCGVAVAFLLSFLLFPAGLMWLSKPKAVSEHDVTEKATLGLANLTLKYGNSITVVSVLLAGLTVWGITRLEVENRFIDYFKSDTEIHQGMLVIDQKLGGTTPLDVVIDAPKSFFEQASGAAGGSSLEDETDELFADDDEQGSDEPDLASTESDVSEDDWLDDNYGDEPDSKDAPNYWYNSVELARLEQVHDFLQSQPEVGKVTSFATAVKMVRMVNNDEPLGDFELALLRKNMPDALRDTFVKPYLADDANQVRLTMRVVDSNPDLRRNELIARLQKDITQQFGFEEGQVKMTGLLVLYNNMLQSLFSSQIMTLGAVMFAIFLMFIVLFRSVFVSAVTIVPNMLAATIVLGLIGWLGIPLDLMTITIAAITVGIAVDDAIHYVYHFKHSLSKNGGDYALAVKEAHASVGKAMYYTTLTIIMGFSILIFSNFVPSVYFGFLAGIAMIAALLSNLLLLPRLLMVFKPFNRGF